MRRRIIARHRTFVVFGRLALAASATFGGGCLVTTKQHQATVDRLAQLEKAHAEQKASSAADLERAAELAKALDAKLGEAEGLLRRNQADLGQRVAQLELQQTQLTGAVENAEFVASAGTQELRELRADIDARLKNLEQKLNEATNIPETKDGLWQEAEALGKRKNHAGARRLLRLYEGRYPDDARIPDVRFQIGLTYFSERDYKSALGEFYRVVQDAPAAPIVPDALYYSGLAFAKLGQCQNAIAYFQALSKPKANAADRYKQKAQEQIQALQADRGQICTDRDDANAGAAAGQGISEAAKPPAAAAPK